MEGMRRFSKGTNCSRALPIEFSIAGARFARDGMRDPESFRVSRVWFVDFRVCMEFRSKNNTGGYVQAAGMYDDYDEAVFNLHTPDDETNDIPFHDTCVREAQDRAADAMVYKEGLEQRRNAYESKRKIINENYEKEVAAAKAAVAEGHKTHVQGVTDEIAAENKRHTLTVEAIELSPAETGDKAVDVTDQVRAALKSDRAKDD
jgi:hypothetical protein